MKNLLMIIPFFPPMAGGGVYRPLGFVRHLQSCGWKPTVIAPRGDAFWIRDDALTQDTPAGCEVVHTSTLSGQGMLSALRGSRAQSVQRSSRGFGLLRRVVAGVLLPDSYVGWYPYAVRAGRRLLEQGSFDAIYSTSPPETSHLIAMKLQRASKLPWVADFRDAWMNLHFLKPPTPLHRAIHRRWEERTCQRAAVVVTSAWHEAELKQRYPGMRSLTRISNGYERADIDAVEGMVPGGNRLRIVHAGMLTQTRTAVPFLKGLRRFLAGNMDARARLEVIFVGPGESDNEAAVAGLGLTDIVTFRDAVSHARTLQLEKTSHILLLIKHVNPAYDGVVPGKLYEYIGLQRPILALVPEGEARARVLELRRGEVVDQLREDDVASTLKTMYDHYQNGTLESAYDLSPQPQFEREHLAARLAELLDVEAGRHGGGR